METYGTTGNGARVRVAIAHPEALFAAGIESLLAARDEVEVVATSTSEGLAAIAAAAPDVVLVEHKTPAGGAALARALSVADAPPPRVVVLDDRDEPRNSRRAARRAGAHGSVLKTASVDELVAQIVRAGRGATAADRVAS